MLLRICQPISWSLDRTNGAITFHMEYEIINMIMGLSFYKLACTSWKTWNQLYLLNIWFSHLKSTHLEVQGRLEISLRFSLVMDETFALILKFWTLFVTSGFDGINIIFILWLKWSAWAQLSGVIHLSYMHSHCKWLWIEDIPL